MRSFTRAAAHGVAACALFVGVPALAQTGNLGLSHQRVVFDGPNRTVTIYVVNRGNVPETYRVDLIEMKMGPHGTIRPVADEPEMSARDYVEFTPRRITLQPRQSQAIRIRLRPPETQGERRSHLAITTQPADDAQAPVASASGGSGQMVDVKVSTLFSVSIPIIVRTDVKEAGARIENSHMTRPPGGGPMLVSFDLVREGAGSVYGDVEIVSGRGRDEHVLARAGGIAVYPEIDRREVQIALPEEAKGKSVRLVYLDREAPASTELAALALNIP